MKKQSYSRTFKLFVVQEVESGKLTKEEARQKYGIKGNSAILNWQRQFTTEKQDMTRAKHVKELDRKELEARIRQLEKQLADEKMKSRAYQIYSEELEKEVSKPTVKK